MNDALRAAALLALEAANAVLIECLDAKAGRYYVLDTSKAEPEVNWPGEALTQIVGWEEAKVVRDTARAERLLSFAISSRLLERDCLHDWQDGAEGAFAGLTEHCSQCGRER